MRRSGPVLGNDLKRAKHDAADLQLVCAGLRDELAEVLAAQPERASSSVVLTLRTQLTDQQVPVYDSKHGSMSSYNGAFTPSDPACQWYNHLWNLLQDEGYQQGSDESAGDGDFQCSVAYWRQSMEGRDCLEGQLLNDDLGYICARLAVLVRCGPSKHLAAVV